MLKHDSKHKRLGWFLFIVYLLLVIYLMFFSEELGRTAHELIFKYFALVKGLFGNGMHPSPLKLSLIHISGHRYPDEDL